MRLMETFKNTKTKKRASTRLDDLFIEASREGLDPKQRARLLDIIDARISKQEAAIRVKVAAADAKVLKIEADAARIKTDGEAAALKIEADGEAAALTIEADGEAAAARIIVNAQFLCLRRKAVAEHRSRARRSHDDAVDAARMNLLKPARAVADLRRCLCIPDTPEGQKQVNDHYVLWQQIAEIPMWIAQSQQPEDEQAAPSPPPPAGPRNNK